ncbi:YcgN family cysteine cluster protein [Hyphomicrobium sp.]|uniref:YcgN family cysteine cluster protein n=1 Tax=Hyphomicrobium sp. TaxID=82 RepID=UPI002E358B2E|nr:YcgN family cysteine cluster protein [Hyphomicrobium sp.]HEX2839839.1 YcgN family cysteine cluster protein [Hyphomicrobium sp.]
MSKRTIREKPAKRDAARPRRSAKLTAKHRLKIATEAGSDAGVWSTGDGGEKPFWETKRLQDMTPAEWDAVCDGCGQCCLNKIEEEDTGRIYLTRLSCRLLDLDSCRCTDYANRFAKMPDCMSIDMKAVRKLKWLPESCGYRRLHEGRGLAWWHPLVSGDPDTVHQAGVSVRGWARSEKGVPQSEIERYIIGEAG